MIDNKLVKLEEKELYTYGVRRLIFWAINIITIFAFGLFFNVLWQLVLYTGTYFILRSYSGGYHAKTEFRCYISMIFLLSIVIAVIKFVPSNSFYLLLFTAFAAGVVLKFAPIDHENKRLDNIEFKHYRKRAIIILFLEVALTICTYYAGLTVISLCLNLALTTNGIMIVLGFAENKRQKQRQF